MTVTSNVVPGARQHLWQVAGSLSMKTEDRGAARKESTEVLGPAAADSEIWSCQGHWHFWRISVAARRGLLLKNEG